MRTTSMKNDFNEKTFMRLHFVSAAYFFVFTSALGAANNYFGISVNGVCKTGTSCPATPLPYNAADTLPVTYAFALSNGDKYLINGSATGSNNSNGGYLPFTEVFQVTYVGNASGGASGTDAITVDWYAAFQTTYGYGNFDEGLVGTFGHGIAAASSASECVNGGSCLGPVTAPGAFSESTNFSEDSSNGVFPFDFQYTLNFGAGSPVGSYIVIGQDTPLRAPKIDSFSPSSGQTGATVTITGTNLTGATAVEFDHVASSYTVSSGTEITATVPCGAATGPIQVATPGGLAASETDFTVTAGKCWSAVDDFSLASNPHGVWSYGYATSFGGTYSLLTTPVNPCITTTNLVCWWNGGTEPDSPSVLYNESHAPLAYENVVLPHNMVSIDGESYEVIVRWTAPASGTYSIAGSFNGIGATGCGQASVNVGVYLDVTTALADSNISSYGQLYAFNVPNLTLSAGTTIDFTGDLTNTSSCDSVGLIATIYEVGP